MLRKIILISFVVILSGCFPMGMVAVLSEGMTMDDLPVENVVKDTLEPLVLHPDYDIYDIRIDIIRQTKEKEVNDSTTKTEKVSYHPVGFYLGNGLFIDLNNNISFLVPALFEVGHQSEFSITKINSGFLMNNKTDYKRTKNKFTKVQDGFLGLETHKVFVREDSIVEIDEGIWSRYTILFTDSLITYNPGIFSTVVRKSTQGYAKDGLFSPKLYTQVDNEVHIGESYFFRYHKNRIDILAHGLFNNEYVKYSIIKSGNCLYVYNQYHSGIEVCISANKMDVTKNARLLRSYLLN